MSLPRELYLAETVRELDRRAIEDHEIPADELMERAGRALYDVLRTRFATADRVLVLCGGGNNGGDGYVVARLAREAGLDVTLAAVSGPGNLEDTALRANHRFVESGGICEEFLPSMPARADVIIDALLGTGIDRRVTGVMADVIQAVNASGKPVVAADLPSGLHADSGAELGVAIKARATVSFIGLKAGLFTGRGPELAGEIFFNALGVPAELADGLAPLAHRLAATDLEHWLPPRPCDAHKGDFGHLVMLGGGEGMPGAIRLAGEAALRSGAGKVTVLVCPENVTAVASGLAELMCRGVADATGTEAIYRRADVLVAGPGLGQDAWAEQQWESFRQRDTGAVPRILDADGLNWLARRPLALTPGDVITPHPGEAARLLDCRVEDIEANRFVAARRLVGRFDCVAVLKGAGTLIAAPDGRMALSPFGNPGMASAGMGDVLTGIVAGLRAQGLEAFDAACAGVLVHGLAGDHAARVGERGLLASDLFRELRACVNPVRGGR